MQYDSNQIVNREGTSPARIRVLVVDDSEVIRTAICRLLEEQSDIEIVCEASNGAEAVDKAREHRPDIVLLDIAMPVMNGLSAARLIKDASPTSKILIFSQFDSNSVMKEAFAAGASGYVVKSEASERLIPELRRIHFAKIAA